MKSLVQPTSGPLPRVRRNCLLSRHNRLRYLKIPYPRSPAFDSASFRMFCCLPRLSNCKRRLQRSAHSDLVLVFFPVQVPCSNPPLTSTTSSHPSTLQSNSARSGQCVDFGNLRLDDFGPLGTQSLPKSPRKFTPIKSLPFSPSQVRTTRRTGFDVRRLPVMPESVMSRLHFYNFSSAC